MDFTFPKTESEILAWKPYFKHVALANRVLAVAKTRIEGVWAAYIDTVYGRNHDQEYQEVLDYGDKLPEKVARALFPDFEDVPYAD